MPRNDKDYSYTDVDDPSIINEEILKSIDLKIEREKLFHQKISERDMTNWLSSRGIKM